MTPPADSAYGNGSLSQLYTYIYIHIYNKSIYGEFNSKASAIAKVKQDYRDDLVRDTNRRHSPSLLTLIITLILAYGTRRRY